MTTIALTGFMATGKSTVGRILAERLGKTFIDLDERIEQRMNMSVAEIFARYGERAFRQLEREELVTALAEDAIVATGGGAIVDPENLARMRAAGPVVCLTASVEAILSRTAADTSRPLLQRADKREQIEALLAARAAAYAQADICIDTTSRSPEEVAEAILAYLGTVLDPKELSV
ncbi:MAG: shikimate kinase [Candidatus Binatia bacterium]|nr:shikimate kinase [Candidatus Binatia bacterium]